MTDMKQRTRKPITTRQKAAPAARNVGKDHGQGQTVSRPLEGLTETQGGMALLRVLNDGLGHFQCQCSNVRLLPVGEGKRLAGCGYPSCHIR